MDVKTVLSECGLDDRHFPVLGIAVPEAYAALNQLSLSTPMLGAFPQGARGLSYLRDIAVQYALEARRQNRGSSSHRLRGTVAGTTCSSNCRWGRS